MTPEQKARKTAATKAWNEANKARKAATAKAWAEAHKERKAATNKAWREANKEREAETARAWSKANRARRRATNKAWHEGNKVRRAEAAKVWREENRGLCNAVCAQRRASKVNATPKWLTPEQHAQIRAWYRLGRATGYHVDHIVPLRGKTVCGLHVPWNLQTLHPIENISKGNRLREAA